MRASRHDAWLLALFGWTLTACANDGLVVAVDVKTDLTPGLEFVGVEVVRLDPDRATEEKRVRAAYADPSWTTGVRVGEFSPVHPGNHSLQVTLFGPDGEARLTRRAIVRVRKTTGTTLVLTRDCVGVECPLPGGDPRLTACLGGRCVDEQCVEGDDEACSPPACSADSDCPASAACIAPECANGVCLQVPRPGACADHERCIAEVGCVPVGEPPDAGPVPTDAGAPWRPDAGPPCLPDADGDGLRTCDGDCDDSDGTVHPGAVDICADCLDQDCDGFDSACDGASFLSFIGSTAAGTRPFVQVYGPTGYTNVHLMHRRPTGAVAFHGFEGSTPVVGEPNAVVWRFHVMAPLEAGEHRFEFLHGAPTPTAAATEVCRTLQVPSP